MSVFAQMSASQSQIFARQLVTIDLGVTFLKAKTSGARKEKRQSNCHRKSRFYHSPSLLVCPVKCYLHVPVVQLSHVVYLASTPWI